ncbi:hypothetical protein ACRE_070080 [Hapsidospora chrysogenum ATCC 11550]|uniref:Uncharacterized protein n=1 Tax=Hapsidospora chrysogenum (strain ATCC 11550 / CBS 779.69 / DSM 880 / IAM 14645 / JCM 23072 / IMI 49137) TaxID=857340 RepID=A0A086SYU5_HAPC1|nr:hypothetical protein ACRE_070080 [Hapsidospora chrysogenum ATCC 11550]
MSIPTQNPPLLLTKRLTAFLQANRTPQIPTLLIISPTGKLLAHASPQPVSLLRTHATVAASLLAIHTSSSPALPSALPGSKTPPAASVDSDEQGDEDEETGDPETGDQDDGGAQIPPRDPLRPATITVQLTGGTVLIRRLKCGLLFVCVGPPSSSSTSSSTSTAPAAGTTAAPGDLPADMLRPSRAENAGETLLTPTTGGGAVAAPVSASPSDADSLVSAGAQTTTSLDSQGATTAVVAMRRHASDLARWLDDKLGTLTVPDDGVGVE